MRSSSTPPPHCVVLFIAEMKDKPLALSVLHVYTTFEDLTVSNVTIADSVPD